MKNEQQLHAACTIWAHNTHPNLRKNWWHVPNGGTRNMAEARQFKSMGVKRGIYDLHCYYRGQFTIIEFKSHTGTLSQEQKEWAKEMQLQGANAYTCNNMERFKEIFLQTFNIT